MQNLSIGDLARSLSTRSRSTQLRGVIDRLSQEISSGQVADAGAHLGGDVRRLSEIDHGLRKLSSFRTTIGEAAGLAEAMQAHIGQIYQTGKGLGESLVSLGQSTDTLSLERIRDEARAALESVTSRLNGAAMGRSLFAGVATDRAPMAGADRILDDLRAAVATETTVQGLITAADSWFADPGGFLASAYAGSDRDIAPVRVDDGSDVPLAVRADDPAFRNVIRDIAMTVLVTDGSIALDMGETRRFLLSAGARSFENLSGVVGVQARVGFAQERLEEAETRRATEESVLSMLRAGMLEADPFDAAVQLENAQFQLESLYAVTVRTSRMTLASFLK